jgi:hypothetical protein
MSGRPCPAAFKVTVAGADGVLPGLELVAVHGDAHRAAGFAPFCAGLLEDFVSSPSASAWRLDLLRTGNNHHAYIRSTLRPRISIGPPRADR